MQVVFYCGHLSLGPYCTRSSCCHGNRLCLTFSYSWVTPTLRHQPKWWSPLPLLQCMESPPVLRDCRRTSAPFLVSTFDANSLNANTLSHIADSHNANSRNANSHNTYFHNAYIALPFSNVNPPIHLPPISDTHMHTTTHSTQAQRALFPDCLPPHREECLSCCGTSPSWRHLSSPC